MMVLSNSVNKSLILRSPFNPACKRQISDATVEKGMKIWGKTIVACIVLGTIIGCVDGVEHEIKKGKYYKDSKFSQCGKATAGGFYYGGMGCAFGGIVGLFSPVIVPIAAYSVCRVVYLNNQKAKNIE